MTKYGTDGGLPHKMPSDLHKALIADGEILKLWEQLTALAKNEFMCWVESAKQIATRKRRIKRTVEELREGKRRPCCWVGCIHRTDKAVSPWAQKVLIDKQPKT